MTTPRHLAFAFSLILSTALLCHAQEQNVSTPPKSDAPVTTASGTAGNLVVTGSVTATNFANSSDRALKSGFATVNPRAVLDRLAALPVQTWSYKSEGADVRHIGPMAQDFKAAFDLGADDKHISTVDAQGVTMAAVQGLYQLAQEKDRQIERLTEEAKGLRSELDDLRARMLQLEEALKRRQK